MPNWSRLRCARRAARAPPRSRCAGRRRARASRAGRPMSSRAGPASRRAKSPSAIERVSRTRLAVRIGIGGGASDAERAGRRDQRGALCGDRRSAASDGRPRGARQRCCPSCTVHIAGPGGGGHVARPGLRQRGRRGGGCEDLRSWRRTSGASLTVDHLSPAAIRWLAAESSGADPVDLLLAQRGRADAGAFAVRLRGADDALRRKTEAEDVRLRILGARTLDQIDGLERAPPGIARHDRKTRWTASNRR